MTKDIMILTVAFGCIACTEQAAVLDAGSIDAFVSSDAGAIADASDNQDAGLEGATDAGHEIDVGTSLDSGVLMDAGVGLDAGALSDAGALDAMSVDSSREEVVDATTRTMFVDLIVQLRDFHAWNGTNIQVFTHDTFENRFLGPARGTIVDGSADLRIPNGFGRDLFGQVGYLWLDRPGDLMCTDGVDPVYLFNINNDFGEGPMIVEVRLSDEPIMIDECGPFTTF